MFQGKLHGSYPMGLVANSFVVEGFQCHNGGTRCNAGLRPRNARTADGSSYMSAVTTVIGRVIIMVIEIVTVIGIIRASVPKTTL